MPKSHKPSERSIITNGASVGDGVERGKFVATSADSNAHVCDKSPTGAHWWKIGHPVDGQCYGTCYFCHETRRFRASLDDNYNGRRG